MKIFDVFLRKFRNNSHGETKLQKIKHKLAILFVTNCPTLRSIEKNIYEEEAIFNLNFKYSILRKI